MSFEDAELLKEFVVESQEHLSDVESKLLTLEEQGDAMDVGLVNNVFRAVHSIKGAAGFMGLSTLESLAHREEEVLNKLRNKELRPTSEVINVLLRATDRLKNLLDSIESSNEMDVAEHVTALQKILNGNDTPEPVAETPVETVAAKELGSGLSAEALREFLVESFDNLEQLERDLMRLEKDASDSEILNSIFRNIHTIKGTSGFLGFSAVEKLTHVGEDLLGSIRSGALKFNEEIGSSLFRMIDAVREMLKSIEVSHCEGNTDHTELLAKLTALLSGPSSSSGKTKTNSKSTAAKPKAKKAQSEPAAQSQPVSPATEETVAPVQPVAAPVLAPPALAAAAAAPASTAAPAAPAVPVAKDSSKTATPDASVAESSIRVDVALLDKLMTCVGELVLARNQILQYSNGQDDNELHATTQRLNIITTELQESVMKTRMQPIGNVWSKFPRLVRDLAVICEKQVRIEMEGKETELDKTIIEAIKDPLTHLVRNTVDHGIERPDVRVANGKPAEGCLTLRAYHEGGQVNIEISDDGAGLNLERIRSKAVEKNLITSEHAARLGDREVAQLIFLPGFSTAEKVSNVSGRGVGMDVVKTNIEKIGGTVDLQTQPGYGTTIKIKIPLTLAIIPALIVTNDSNRYAIPQVNLLELVRLDGDDAVTQIEWIQGAPVYRLRGRLLPLVYLCEVLKTGTHEDLRKNSDSLNIVVLRADDQQFGLVVDRINDSEEIVVKPLSKQLKGISVYSGTTIMGDGKVALIMDVLGLAHDASVISQNRDQTIAEQTNRTQQQSSESQTLLVMGVGENSRCAVPLSQVTRLEKLGRTEIEYSHQRQVVQYRGEILPLLQLNDILGVPTYYADDKTEVDVVVYTEGAKSIGVVVDRIIDIVDTCVSTTKRSGSPGQLGSVVISEHVTDMLDLSEILRRASPELFDSSSY